MTIQLVVASKPELFESDKLADRYHGIFRRRFTYSFPKDIGLDNVTLVNLAKQMFLANIQMEFGAEFLGGEIHTTADYFDRWWTVSFSDGIQEDLENCDVELASDLLNRLDRREREHIFSMQSLSLIHI